MLCLSRRTGERVRLRVPLPGGGHTDIWVVLVETDRGKVRLGFDCPREVEVMREENLRRRETRTED